MKSAHWLRIGPIARLSLGLVALLVSLVMVADMLLGVVPEFGKSEREARRRIAENLVIQISTLLEAGNTGLLNRTIQQVLARDPDDRLHLRPAHRRSADPAAGPGGACHCRVGCRG